MSKHDLRASDLEQFRGGDTRYMHWTRRLVYTEGVQYMAEKGGAYWLIDAIASYQNHKRIRTNPMLRDFQLWELKVRVKNEQRAATLTMRADSDQGTIIRQRIEYTDFPLDYIRLYVEGDTLLLPSEH